MTVQAQTRPHVSRFTFHARSEAVELSIVTALFLVLTLAMTWPWVLHMNEAINPFGDVVVQMTSLRWNAHALATNPLGLFEAPFFYPYAHALAFSENLLGQTILALPILRLTGNPALAGNFNILLSFVLTGLFTYLLARDLTGSRAAGLFAGVAFAFCPFRFMQMGHLHMLATQWFPLTLWALARAFRLGNYGLRITNDHETFKRSNVQTFKRFAVATLGFIAMGLSSVYYTYFLALTVALFVVWYFVIERPRQRDDRPPLRPLLIGLAASGFVTALVLAPIFLPYLQSNQELGFSRSTYEVRNWQAEWSFFGNVLQSNWLYGKVLAPAMTSAGGERELFFGIVPALLAVVGLIWGRGRTRFFYALLGLVALVLTFGLSAHIPFTSLEVPLPYAFLYDWVPGFKALRVPVRFAVLLDLSIYVLAGYGLARLLAATANYELRITNYQQGDANNSKFKIQNSKFSRSLVLTAALTFLVLLEFINPLDTSNRRDVMGLLNSTEPYGWLSRSENAGPIVELPMTAGQDDVWYTFFDTRHWQPLVNGWSSFVPPGTVRLKQALDAFPDPSTVALLQGLDVRNIVVHLWQFPRDAQADLKRRLDSTPELKLVDTAGDNYVYELEANPWLRDVAKQVGNGTLWVGELRHGSMPTHEVLAYALQRLGIPASHMGGDINIGYKPLGDLPFGTTPDYLLTRPGDSAMGLPFGFAGYQPADDLPNNSAARLLAKPASLLKSYDFRQKGAPPMALDNLALQVGEADIAFGASPGASSQAGPLTRTLDLSLLSFTPVTGTLSVGSEGRTVQIPAGISHYRLPVRVGSGVTFSAPGSDARLLRADLLSAPSNAPGDERPVSKLYAPLEVTPSVSGNTIQARARMSGLKGPNFTATIDVYSEPWGTHPDGHFGSWSVPLSDNGAPEDDFTFTLDPLAKQVTTTRGGQPVETFSWLGPPTQGDFRASLNITWNGKLLANVPVGLFTIKDGQLADVQLDPSSLVIVQPTAEQ